jgi:hypothetical protein
MRTDDTPPLETWDDVLKHCEPGSPADRFARLCRTCPNADLYLDLFKAMRPVEPPVPRAS